MFVMYTSSLVNPTAASIFVRSCPARPTNGSPCRSSSRPGASPMKTIFADREPLPKTVRVRPSQSPHRRQEATSRSRESRSAASGSNRSAGAGSPKSELWGAAALSREKRIDRSSPEGEAGEVTTGIPPGGAGGAADPGERTSEGSARGASGGAGKGAAAR